MEISANLSPSFRKIESGQYASLYYNEELLLTVCQAETEYIPIESFKEIFLRVSEMLNQYPMEHFVFDKRTLRTFHQPSMEWYFSTWKPQIAKSGLTSHFKILPEHEWFKQAVNAGKNEIMLKIDPELLAGITIRYVDDIEEAISLVSNKNSLS